LVSELMVPLTKEVIRIFCYRDDEGERHVRFAEAGSGSPRSSGELICGEFFFI
jgi:hypothetical protein